MNILVTGGAGFIGSHTVVELHNAGHTPIIIDNFDNSEKTALQGIKNIIGKDVKCYAQDCRNQAAVEEIIKSENIDGVIHFAAHKAVGESVQNPVKYYENNLTSTLILLKAMRNQGVKNLVFSSSCTVYGEPKGSKIVTELTPGQEANSPYGATKQMCERIISDVNKSGSDMRMLNLRYFNPVGAHPTGDIGELPIGKPNNLLPFVTQTAAGLLDELTVFGNDYNTEDGTCVRDYIHVVDLAQAHIKGYEWLSDLKEPTIETINVGTGNGVSVLEIIHTFEEVSNQTLNWKFGPRRAGDVEQIYADTSKALQLINWKAELSIKDAVKDAWNWQKKLGNE